MDRYLLMIEDHREYIAEQGHDSEDITSWRWNRG
jgi:phosphoketolase